MYDMKEALKRIQSFCNNYCSKCLPSKTFHVCLSCRFSHHRLPICKFPQLHSGPTLEDFHLLLHSVPMSSALPICLLLWGGESPFLDLCVVRLGSDKAQGDLSCPGRSSPSLTGLPDSLGSWQLANPDKLITPKLSSTSCPPQPQISRLPFSSSVLLCVRVGGIKPKVAFLKKSSLFVSLFFINLLHLYSKEGWWVWFSPSFNPNNIGRQIRLRDSDCYYYCL